MDAIQIEGLTKHYKDVVAVDNLNLSVKQGEIFSLLGVKGAGGTDTAACSGYCCLWPFFHYLVFCHHYFPMFGGC
ncbi:MAG: hypothetical protein PUH08_04965 [Treponema sp.]|nr:hypothetical protein [Treponema sp.]MDY3755556.1 hypothetical protein [Treponema sp.]MDY4675008.1 hypothetical protein [Treponema sp.]